MKGLQIQCNALIRSSFGVHNYLEPHFRVWDDVGNTGAIRTHPEFGLSYFRVKKGRISSLSLSLSPSLPCFRYTQVLVWNTSSCVSELRWTELVRCVHEGHSRQQVLSFVEFAFRVSIGTFSLLPISAGYRSPFPRGNEQRTRKVQNRKNNTWPRRNASGAAIILRWLLSTQQMCVKARETRQIASVMIPLSPDNVFLKLRLNQVDVRFLYSTPATPMKYLILFRELTRVDYLNLFWHSCNL